MIACYNEHVVQIRPTKKIWETQIWIKRTKLTPEIRFFAIFSSLVHLFSFKLHKIIAWNNL